MDASLYRAVNRLADRTGWAHPLVVAYARYGIAVFAVLLLAAWWAARRRHDLTSLAAAIWAGAGTIAAWGLGQGIGNAIDRARPYAAMPGVHVLIDRTTDFSFPSDHAIVAGAVAAGLWLAHRRLGLWAAVLAAAMAASRVYVGAHYPGDVVAGLALGAVTVLALSPLATRVLEPVLRRLERTPIRRLISARPA